MEKRLQDMLPVLGVENDLILSKAGDVTIVYECELPELFTLSDRDYEAFHQAWVKAIKVLPKHCVFHKQDWFLTPATKQIMQESFRFYQEAANGSLTNVLILTTDVLSFSLKSRRGENLQARCSQLWLEEVLFLKAF